VSTEQGLMHGRVVFVSRRAETLTGYPCREFAAHPSLWANLIHPDDLSLVMATTMQMAESGQPVTRDYRLKDRDGNFRWMEDRVTPEFDESGRLRDTRINEKSRLTARARRA
jgi:PAS domain S-box-containing protein